MTKNFVNKNVKNVYVGLLKNPIIKEEGGSWKISI